MLSRLQNPVELSHGWVLKISNQHELAFHMRVLDDSEESPFEISSGCTKVDLIRKPVPCAHKFYVFQDSKSSCVLFLLLSGDKVVEDCF